MKRATLPDLRQYRAKPGARVKLERLPTRVAPPEGRHGGRTLLDEQAERIGKLQEKLHAASSHALLIIFQGMDAAGKDSAVDHVLSQVDPQGCQVTAFKQPSADELAHDFLWRTTRALPPRGLIGVFNRSYYEEVLVVRVHPEYLAGQHLAAGKGRHAKAFWEQRYRSINQHEAHLTRNNTRVLKFFLHVSHEEQRERFLRRIEDPKRNWKFGAGDVAERAHWTEYQEAYEACIEATSTEHAPWHVIPADDKHGAHLIVATAVVEALESMDLAWPVLDAKGQAALKVSRDSLLAETAGKGAGAEDKPARKK